MKENVFQASLIRTIKNLLPGCIVLKLDPNYIQGIPDLLVLYGITWVALETKRSQNASKRPNQEFYINKMNEMSFATFVYPENVQQVLEDMVDHFDKINRGEFIHQDIIEKNVILQSVLNQYDYRVA